MNASLALDLLIAALLCVTIGYSFVLYRRLASLRRSNAEMGRMVRKFSHSIERAQTGMLTMRSTGMEMSSALQERTDAARVVGDDLDVLTNAGNRLADRLDALVSESRAQVQSAGNQSGTVKWGGAKPGPRLAKVARSETEHELAETLRGAR